MSDRPRELDLRFNSHRNVSVLRSGRGRGRPRARKAWHHPAGFLPCHALTGLLSQAALAETVRPRAP
jgi:hypothetical protein